MPPIASFALLARTRGIAAASRGSARAPRRALGACCVAYVAGVALMYVALISPAFAYAGYVVLDPGPLLAVGLVAAALPALWAPLGLRRPSEVVFWLLYLVAYVPASLMPHFVLDVDGPDVAVWNAVLLASLTLLSRVPALPPLRALPRLDPPAWLLAAGLGAFTALAYGYVLVRVGLPTRVVGIADVYAARDEYKRALDGVPYLAYVLEWQGNVVTPLLLALAVLRRSVLLGGAAVIGQLYLFQVTGYKSLLFATVAVPALALALERRSRLPAVWLMGAALALLGAAGLAHLAGWEAPAHLLVRRLLVTPGLVTSYYWEFFSNQPPALLSHSVLSPFVEARYHEAPPGLIGLVYFGSAETSANGGLWADAFANFRYAGVAAFTLVCAAVLWGLDQAASGGRAGLAALAVVPGLTLANSALLTTVLTHGLGALILVLWLMPRERRVRPGLA